MKVAPFQEVSPKKVMCTFLVSSILPHVQPILAF